MANTTSGNPRLGHERAGRRGRAAIPRGTRHKLDSDLTVQRIALWSAA